MTQLPLFPNPYPPAQVVNIASVPQRSPFRYPGGKTWLVPIIRQWLGSFATKPHLLVEAFAGGASVGLTAAFEALTDAVLLVELDEQVGAVWQTIIEDDSGGWLAHRIATFDFTADNIEMVLRQSAPSMRERAFQTIIKNRVNRGGILAAGAGKIKAGEAGKGIRSRWYPETLKKRILDIAIIRQRLHFLQGDGIEVIERYKDDPNAVFFIDPPYTAAGKKAGNRLYTHSELNHEALFKQVATLTGNFLMTYDNNIIIQELAAQHRLETREIAMKNTHHSTMTELLISRDMHWMT